MQRTYAIKNGWIDICAKQDGIDISGGKLLGFEVLESPLFCARIKNLKTGEDKTLYSSCGFSKVDILEDGRTLAFYNPQGVENLSIFLSIALTKDAIIWTGKVINNSQDWSVMEIDYPTPRLYGKEFTLLVPHASGIAFKNAGKRGYHYDHMYPSSRACMQYFAVYDNIGGVYVATEDKSASIKKYIVNAGEDKVDFKLICYAPDGNRRNNSFELFGECKWQVFKGDWYDASMIYFDFVESKASWLPSLGENGREDLCDEFRNIGYWISDGMLNSEHQRDNIPKSLYQGLKDYPEGYWKDAPIKLRKELGVPIAYHVYNWHQIPFNVEYPHFLPAKDEFVRGAKEMQDNGVYVVPYINSVSWETTDGLLGHEINFDNTGKYGATINEDGSIFSIQYPQTNIKGENVQLAPICPSFKTWHDIISDVSTKMHQTLPIDGIYFDEIAAHQSNLCYNPDHGHTLGGGSYWVDGYNALMEQAKLTKPKNAYYFTECNAEPYLKSFDGFLSWYWVADEQVPAFSAVYAPYIQFVGRYMIGHKKGDYEFFKYNMAQSLLYGQVLGWYKADVVYDKKAMSFLKPLVLLRHKYNDFFANAKMLRPPVVKSNLPDKQTTPALHFTETVNMQQVEGGLWQERKTGKVVLFLTNIAETDAEVEISFTLDDNIEVTAPFNKVGDKYVGKMTLSSYQCLAFEFNKKS